jgi:hypothetical protein
MIPKPGYKTTEFILTVLANLSIGLAAVTEKLSPHWAAITSAVSTGLYALARGLAKLRVPTP